MPMRAQKWAHARGEAAAANIILFWFREETRDQWSGYLTLSGGLAARIATRIFTGLLTSCSEKNLKRSSKQGGRSKVTTKPSLSAPIEYQQLVDCGMHQGFKERGLKCCR
jgi:hypothetical protein